MDKPAGEIPVVVIPFEVEWAVTEEAQLMEAVVDLAPTVAGFATILKEQLRLPSTEAQFEVLEMVKSVVLSTDTVHPVAASPPALLIVTA